MAITSPARQPVREPPFVGCRRGSRREPTTHHLPGAVGASSPGRAGLDTPYEKIANRGRTTPSCRMIRSANADLEEKTAPRPMCWHYNGLDAARAGSVETGRVVRLAQPRQPAWNPGVGYG